MEFKYCDRNGTSLKPCELKELNLWNPVMEHILTGVVCNAGTEKITEFEALEG